jgi:hypothetical protein
LLIALAGVLAAGAVACNGDDDGGDPSPTPQQPSAGEAERPDWFPVSFPLPADTTLASEAESEGGGGTARFDAPVPLTRLVQVLDLNLDSHGYVVTNRDVSDTEAAFTFESSDYTGTATAQPSDPGSVLEVTLTPK